MSDKIPTARQIVAGKAEAERMIEFAKLHVKAALKAAANSSFKSSSGDWNVQHTPNAKDSILNAYPENLIQ